MICNDCGIDHPEDMFYNHSRGGKWSTCKLCISKRCKENPRINKKREVFILNAF